MLANSLNGMLVKAPLAGGRGNSMYALIMRCAAGSPVRIDKIGGQDDYEMHGTAPYRGRAVANRS